MFPTTAGSVSEWQDALTVYLLAGFRKVKVQTISLEARVIRAEVLILPREEERKKQQEPHGRNPEEAEVSAQWAAGLEATRPLNKCSRPL